VVTASNARQMRIMLIVLSTKSKPSRMRKFVRDWGGNGPWGRPGRRQISTASALEDHSVIDV
jgi:hypothetical protein